MKKKISLALSVGVLLTAVTPTPILASTESAVVISNSKEDVEKYIPKIKSIFQIGDEYGEFDIQKFHMENIIRILWQGDNDHIGVTIDDAGNIVGYDKRKYDRHEKIYKFPKITREEGEKIAREFIKKVKPDIVDKIEINNDSYITYNAYGLDDYLYEFIRTENNIPLNNYTVSVEVDSQKGEVIGFYSHDQSKLKIPSKEGIISEEEAREIYKEKVGIELVYKLRGVDHDLKTYLGYSIADMDKTVDAKTRDIVSTSYYSGYPLHMYQLYDNSIERISNKDETELISSKVIMSRKDAGEKIINAFDLGKEYEIADGVLIKFKREDQYVWEVMIMKNEGNVRSSSSAQINAKTGEIINFRDYNSWSENENDKVKYKKEELLKKSKDFIQKVNPDKYKETEYLEKNNTNIDEEIYGFGFSRKSNDIKVEENGFIILISAITGNIVEYSYNWTNLELQLPENIIDEGEAKEILIDGKGLELEYQSLNQDEKDLKLVYDFKEKHLSVDASTGEIIDISKEIKDKYSKKEYKDIENSFVKNHINKLQDHIVLFEGENFNPKEAISQKDFLNLLIQTTGLYYNLDDEDYLYDILTRKNIVMKDEKNPQGKITREEAMKYIVKAFGQEQAGDLGNIYKIDYSDAEQISDNLKGHVAIASGLGVISGEGNFRPKDNLTREEAIVLIYNILNRGN